MKTCKSCQESKPFTEYYATHYEGKRVGKTVYYSTKCRKCETDQKRKSPYRKKLDRNLRNRTGIGIDEYDVMFEGQAGKCLICDGTQTHKRLAVDHCHTTGKVRGLLCERCNFGLGHFRDNIDYLKKAIEYLNDSIS